MSAAFDFVFGLFGLSPLSSLLSAANLLPNDMSGCDSSHFFMCDVLYVLHVCSYVYPSFVFQMNQYSSLYFCFQYTSSDPCKVITFGFEVKRKKLRTATFKQNYFF